MAKVDAYVLTDDDYEEISPLTDEFFERRSDEDGNAPRDGPAARKSNYPQLRPPRSARGRARW